MSSVARYPKQSSASADGRLLPFLHGSEEFDLRGLMMKLWRRKGIIALTTIALTTIALLVILQLTPLYTASANVLIASRQAQLLDLEAVVAGIGQDTAAVESEIQLIRSRGLAEKTITELDLDRNPEFNPALRQPGFVASLIGSVVALPAAWFGSGAPAEEAMDDGLTDAERAAIERQRVVDVFLGKLAVARVGLSNVVKISFESENPRIAALVANTHADFYIVAQLEAKFEATKRANRWLNTRLAELRQEVQVAEKAVEDYREQSGLIRGKDVTIATQETMELSSELVVAQAARTEAEVRLRQVEKVLHGEGGAQAVTEVLQSNLIQNLRQQEAEIVRKVAELSQQYGARHPLMINARAELNDLQAKIHTEVEKIVQSLRNEVAVARAREASLASSLDKLKGEVAALNRSEVQLRALEREAMAVRTLFETFLARSKETGVQEDFQQPDAQIISNAALPDDPSFPNRRFLLILAFASSLFTGILLAFAIEQMDNGFRSAEQVEQLMGVSTLGLVPVLKGVLTMGKKADDYILQKPASALGESIRSVHTSLLLSDVDKRPKVVLLASSVPNEGKTTVARSLARMLAKSGQKVVVVDCDLRRPSAHETFSVPLKPGLVDYLAADVSLNEVIYQDQHSPAYIIPAGSSAPNPADLLASAHMKSLLKVLAGRYDLVLIDSAPVLAVSDTRVLSRLVDKTVFLVRWAETRRETAISGLRQIVDAGGDVAGVVLTMVDVKRHAKYNFSDSGLYYGSVRKYYQS